MTLASAIASFNTSECVKDYNGEIYDFMLISTDLNVWAGREVLTVSELEEWINFNGGFSDCYKDVNGFRPRWDFTNLTLSDWRKEYACLERDMERELEMATGYSHTKMEVANATAHAKRVAMTHKKNFSSIGEMFPSH